MLTTLAIVAAFCAFLAAAILLVGAAAAFDLTLALLVVGLCVTAVVFTWRDLQ